MSDPSQDELRQLFNAAGPSQDELRAAFEAAKPAPEAKPSKYDPSTKWGPYLMNEAKRGLAGLAALPALPMDALGTNIVNLVRGATGAERLPAFYLMDQARKGVESLIGVDQIKPANLGQEIAGDITQFAVPSIPMTGLAMRGAPLAQKASILASEVLQDVLGGAGTTAGRNLGGEPGAAVGGLVGGLSASTIPALARKGYDVAKQFVTPEGNKAWQYGRAGRELEVALKAHVGSERELADSAKTVARVEALGGKGFNPSLQARSGSVAVEGLESTVNASTPQRLERAIQNFDDSVKALETARSRAFPSPLTRDAYVAAAHKRVVSAETALDDVLSRITEARKRLAASVTGDTAQKAGAKLEQLADMQYKAMKKVRDEKYAEVYRIADDAGVRMNMDDVLAAVKQIEKDHPNVFQDMPGSFKDVIARYGAKESDGASKFIPPGFAAPQAAPAKPVEVPFSEFHSLWKELGKDASAASQSGKFGVAQFAGQVRDLMKAKLNDVAGQPTEVGQAFAAANRWFDTKFAPAFREGLGGQIVTPGRWGERIAQEKMIARFFTPSGMDDFAQIFGSNAQAAQQRHEAILGLFSRDADVIKNGGVMSKNAGLTFYEKHKEALDKIPATRDVILNVGRRNDELTANAQKAAKEVMAADRAMFSQVTKAGNPDAVVGKALSDGNFDDLARLMTGSQAQRETTARIIADNIAPAAERLGITPSEYVIRFGDKLKPLMDQLGPGHYRNLKVLASGETLIGRQAAAPAHAQIAPDETAGALSRAATTLRGIGQRHSSEAWLAQSFLLRWWGKLTKETRMEALHKASLDPEFAASLSKAFRMKETPSLVAEIESNFARLGVKIAAAQEGSDKE